MLGASAQDKASKQAAQQSEEARAWVEKVYGDASGNLNPYITTGTNALYSLSSLYGLGNGPNGQGSGAAAAFKDFTKTPAYMFPQQQGNLAVNRALAAQGLTGSGAQAKGVAQYNQGYASQGFDTYLQRLQALASGGQNAAGNLGSIGNGGSASIVNASGQIGNALAGGTIGSANSLTGGIGGALAALGNNNPSSTSFGPGSAFGQLGTGIGNLFSGSAWNGMASGNQLQLLNNQALTNIAGGAGPI